MPLLKAINDQPHGPVVRAYDDILDRRVRAIDFGAAVACLVDISVGLKRVTIRVFCGGLVNRLGEREFEAIGLRVHLMNFEWDLVRPNQSLKGERLSSSRA